jgi:hypothetical protein
MADSVSRRRFLTQTSVGVAGGLAAGVAATSGLSLATLLAPVSTTPAGKAVGDLAPLGEDVVVHIRDASSGQVSLFVANREIVHHDPELVDRVLTGVRRAGTEA